MEELMKPVLDEISIGCGVPVKYLLGSELASDPESVSLFDSIFLDFASKNVAAMFSGLARSMATARRKKRQYGSVMVRGLKWKS